MFKKTKIFSIGLVAAILSFELVGTMVAQKAAVPKNPNTVALGEDEVKQLLLLMDADKNGKISKKEFMDFMSAEFDRLDKDKSGELDQKELRESQIRPSRPAAGK